MDPVDMLSSESNYDSDISDDGSATKLIEIPKYKCKYCPKRYSKTQALGGHQNAHKREGERDHGKTKTGHVGEYEPAGSRCVYPYPFPSHYAVPPGFEQPRYTVDGPDNLAGVFNQCIGSSSSDFARLQIDSSQGMARGWAITGNPYHSVMAQPQPLLSTSSPVCLDLCLGVGSSSQDQAQPKEANDATQEKEDNDDLSLSLSLKL